MYYDDIKFGMTVQIAPVIIKKDKMMDFARTYEHISLHTNEEYVKASPFGRIDRSPCNGQLYWVLSPEHF